VTQSGCHTIPGTFSGLRTTQEAAAIVAGVPLLALGPLPAGGDVVSRLACNTNGNARFGELVDKPSGSPRSPATGRAS
jgi:hypothetical protein